MFALGSINKHLKYGRNYFGNHILPKYEELFKEIDVSHRDASKMFDAFAKMDVDGSESISCAEFHRYFGWKRGVFTERIFDSFLAPEVGSRHHLTGKKDGLSFGQFVVCVWNYCSYDEQMMAQYVFNIFDIDKLKKISMDECYALFRMIYYNQKVESCDAAIKMTRHHVKDDESITLASFQDLVVDNKDIIRPAFDYQSRIIERTTVNTSSWDKRRVKRRSKFGSEELVDVKFNDKIISNCIKSNITAPLT